MTKQEMKKLCGPEIIVDEKWVDGWLVCAASEDIIFQKLEPLGFEVKGIGIGYDYNRRVYTLFVNGGIRENIYQAKAETIWGQLDDNQKAGIRIGFFPAEVMSQAAEEGFDDGKELSVALMKCASKNGGMIA